VVGVALPLESEIGEVRREANGWDPAAARERGMGKTGGAWAGLGKKRSGPGLME
jgi:hypothetical protein